MNMSQHPQPSPAIAFPIAGPSSQPQEPKKRPRRNLSKAGAALLQEYARKWRGQEPDLAMRKSLLAELHNIPGCDFYTLASLNNWLRAHLHVPPARAERTPSRFSSLNEAVRGQLAALLSMELDPSPEKVRLWATMVKPTGATYTDVVDWVIHMQIELKKRSMYEANRLPTPANTVTPEPSPVLKTVSPVASPVASPVSPPVVAYTGTHSYYCDHAKQARSLHRPLPPPDILSRKQPPLLRAQMQAHRGSPPPFSPMSPIVSPTSPIQVSSPPMNTTNISSQTNRKQSRPPVQCTPRFQDIVAQSVVDAAASPTTPKESLPTSAAEFNKLFAPYEAKLLQLMKALESKHDS